MTKDHTRLDLINLFGSEEEVIKESCNFYSDTNIAMSPLKTIINLIVMEIDSLQSTVDFENKNKNPRFDNLISAGDLVEKNVLKFIKNQPHSDIDGDLFIKNYIKRTPARLFGKLDYLRECSSLNNYLQDIDHAHYLLALEFFVDQAIDYIRFKDENDAYNFEEYGSNPLADMLDDEAIENINNYFDR